MEQNVLSSSCCGPRYQLLFFIRWLKCAVNIRNKKQWDVEIHSNLHCYIGTITHDQGILLVLPPLRGTNLTGWFWHLSCQRLRGRAVLRVPRTSISGLLCLLFSEPLSEGEHHHLLFGRGQTACDSPEVKAENPHANKLLFFVTLCLLWEIMQCLKVLAQIMTSTCQGIPHVEWMQEI